MSNSPRQREFERASTRIGINLAALVTARVVTMAMTLVQMGVIFRVLGVAGSGQFVFALSFASLFTVFATLGIQRLLVRDISRDYEVAWTLVWTATAVVIGLSAVVFAIVSGSVFAIEANPVIRHAVMLATLSFVVFWAVQCPFEALLTARERMLYVAVVYIATGAIKLVGIVLLLHKMPSSAHAHAIVAVAHGTGLLLCVIFAIRVGGWQPPRLDLRLAVDQVRECFPFLLAMICSQVYFKSDMSILKFMRGEMAAGLYGPAQRTVEPIMMIASIWGTVVFPALCRSSVHAADQYARLKRTSLRLALLVAFPMAVGIACLAGPITRLLAGPGYEQSVVVLRVLCLAIPMFYLNGVGQEFFYAAHRNWLVVGAYAVGAAVSVSVNLVAIAHLGVAGVALGAIAANFAISLLFIRGLQHEFGAMELVPLMGRTLVACAIMAAVVWPFVGRSWVAGIPVGAGAYVAAQWLLGVLSADERELVTRLVCTILPRGARKPPPGRG
ncbi:MAG TPA: flippase [Candidatus Hydrogenedentes bacterium]|nr:flippase [Candidatus Hydrogenedentota bacterium]HPG68026.1 flippase [Candidatus Hydrogenedentota bacterium]